MSSRNSFGLQGVTPGLAAAQSPSEGQVRQDEREVKREERKLADLVEDYWSAPSAEQIKGWLEQFDEEVRLALVSEVRRVLSESYLSSKTTQEFWKNLITAFCIS
jgi:hypothetical protein